MNVKLPAGVAPILKAIYRESRRSGLELFAVGGCVRDWLLELESKDLDFIAEKDPLPIAQFCVRRWGGKIQVFDRFLTVRVFVSRGFRIDFARARAESYPEPAALPVVEPASLQHDLIRRDFTVNAMATPLIEEGFGKIHDPYRGTEDLHRKTLRVLHSKSFQDDPTRMHRAARFSCRFGFRLDSGTEIQRRDAVKSGWAKLLSRERLRTELVRILEERNPLCALKKLKSWRLSGIFHPDFSWPANLAEGRDAWQRLGMIAMHVGSAEGIDIIESLHLERPIAQALIEALKLSREKTAPRTKIAPLTQDVLRLAFQSEAASAFKPLCISGRDLKAFGLKPGPDYKTWLDRAARAQWRGKFSTRPEALRWLKSELR